MAFSMEASSLNGMVTSNLWPELFTSSSVLTESDFCEINTSAAESLKDQEKVFKLEFKNVSTALSFL